MVITDRIVRVELTLTLRREVIAALIDAGRVFDLAFVVTHRNVVTMHGGTGRRDERLHRTEHAHSDGHPFRLPGAIIEEDLTDLADLDATGVQDRTTVLQQCSNIFAVHSELPSDRELEVIWKDSYPSVDGWSTRLYGPARFNLSGHSPARSAH
ncbi:hypothetical protein [Humibacter antri]